MMLPSVLQLKLPLNVTTREVCSPIRNGVKEFYLSVGWTVVPDNGFRFDGVQDNDVFKFRGIWIVFV
jgi:hypothetical protein